MCLLGTLDHHTIDSARFLLSANISVLGPPPPSETETFSLRSCMLSEDKKRHNLQSNIENFKIESNGLVVIRDDTTSKNFLSISEKKKNRMLLRSLAG
jgi:hypothetical protein